MIKAILLFLIFLVFGTELSVIRKQVTRMADCQCAAQHADSVATCPQQPQVSTLDSSGDATVR